MKKIRNIVIALVVAVVVIAGGSFAVYKLWFENDLYTVQEKKYIIDNKSKVISINVANDANVFGREGTGVFYDFLKNFEKDNDLTFDIITTSVSGTPTGLSLTKNSVMPNDAKLIHTDHYVLVGKTRINVANV